MSELDFNILPYEPLIFIISGLSGAGKDAVVRYLKEKEPRLHFVVTVNTRPPRPEEKEGVDYYFVSEERYFQMRDSGDLLESAQVYNEYKGVPKKDVYQALRQGKDALLRLDVQGAATIKAKFPAAVSIFLTTQDEEEWLERLKARKTESIDDLQKRIETAREELKCAKDFDYIVHNRHDRLEEAVQMVRAIIQVEHLKASPRKMVLV